eukprot:gene4861-3482_t
MEPEPRFSVLAVLGCGHDGRLGLGDPLQHNAVLSTDRVTLVPFFLDTLVSMGDSIRSVHCGGYHTIVLTASGALYGWGLHEDGQLGFGKARGKDFYSSPTRMAFFDALFDQEVRGRTTEGLAERSQFILDVSCGAAHSMVLTQSGLYVSGKNTYGQLGLGTDVDVFEWTLLTGLVGGCRLHHRRVLAFNVDTDLAAAAPPRQQHYLRVLHGELTHISCGTHHSLLAWRDAVVECDGEEGAATLEYHPLLLVAAGKGDFGELGYDGDSLAVMQALEKRQHAALQWEASRTKMQGGINTDDKATAATSTSTTPYSGAWWKQKRAKVRRPEFFSPHFLPVRLPLLLESVVREADAVAAAQRSSACDSPWEVAALRAMHLHSAVVLRHADGDAAGTERVFHWGCYYNNEVEGLESSIPVEEAWEGSSGVGLHAGSEGLFRYRSGPAAPLLMARGSGSLGTGVENAFETAWTAVEAGWRSVRALEGRDHYVVLADGADDGELEVWGFGSNLHGQLGPGEGDLQLSPVPLLRRGDFVRLPSSALVAVPADCAGEWKVRRIHTAGAGVNHTIFLVDPFQLASELLQGVRNACRCRTESCPHHHAVSLSLSLFSLLECHHRTLNESCFGMKLRAVSSVLRPLAAGHPWPAARTTLSAVARRCAYPVLPSLRQLALPCLTAKRGMSSEARADRPGPCSAPFPQEFLEELSSTACSFPEKEWIRVSDLYRRLSPDSRREIVRPHKTLSAVLQLVANEVGVTLHDGGVYWCRGSPPSSPAVVDAKEDDKEEESLAAADDCTVFHSNEAGSGRTIVSAGRRATFLRPRPSPFSPALAAVEHCQPVDFFYDVGLTEVPPPPTDFNVTPSSLGGVRPTEDGSVISLKSFVAYIPYFFVPLHEVLAQMPGYTEQHIESYFRSPAVEMVTIEGQRYIRLFGGYGKISLEGCEASEERFRAYKPDLSLAEPFVKAFEGITEMWMPLGTLLSRAGEEAVAQLPFQGAAAIIYFAQMQHLFAFAVDQKNGGAVLLRPPGYGGLEANTTPTPKSINFIVRYLPLEGTCDIAHVEAAVPPALMEEIKQYYGSLSACLEKHGPLFYVEHSVVMLTNYKRRMHVASLPLEEQLQIAMQRRDKSKIRTLRRRIAFRDNPSHPFHDPDNLAREVARHLPKKGFVTLKQFMKRGFSEELLFFMPKKTHNFFTKYPQYFTIFEFQHPGAWCVSRPEEPLPKGVIRKDFSDSDIIRLIAQYLQQKGPKSCTQILVNLPRGAHESIKKQYGGMYYLVTKHPEYFNVIVGSESRNAVHSAVVHLLKVPGVELSASHTSFGSSSSPEAADDDEDKHLFESQHFFSPIVHIGRVKWKWLSFVSQPKPFSALPSRGQACEGSQEQRTTTLRRRFVSLEKPNYLSPWPFLLQIPPSRLIHPRVFDSISVAGLFIFYKLLGPLTPLEFMAPKKRTAKDSFSAFSVQSTAILKTYTQKLQPKRRLFPSQKALFPLLDIFELDVNWKFTFVGIIIETFQLVGLLVNNNIPWGVGIKGIIDKVSYFFVFPFFDEGWISGLQVVWYVLVCVLLALAIGLLVGVVFYTQNNVHSMSKFISWGMKYFMHLLPSVLVIPIFSILGATGSCDRPYEKNYWDGNECWTGVGGAFHIVSYLTMLLYIILLYISIAFCFDDMPDNTNLAARPRCSFHALIVAAKVVVTLLFHILVPVEEGLAFCIVYTIIGIAVITLVVLILPYYDLMMNRLRAMQWGIATGAAIVGIICEATAVSFSEKVYTTIILVVCIVLGGIAGFCVPAFRRSGKLTRRMAILNKSGLTVQEHPDFPANLPEHDLVLCRYPRIEKLLIGHHRHDEHGGAHGRSDSIAELDAYLDAVHFPSDIEVACRFLREYSNGSADASPTKLMVIFAARIYTKGMAKYPNNPQIQYLFCMFLAIYAKKLRMSLTELTLLVRDAPYLSIPLSYRTYRLTERLKTSLNMLNSTHIHLASISSELHREIIGAMSSFWGCLANGTQSTVDLTEIADYITAKRENCKSFYDSTLQSPSENILLNYSTFLRDVMLDEEGAAALRERVLEEVEMRRTRRANQHKRGNASLSSSRGNENWNSCQLMVKTAQQRQKYDGTDENAGLAHSKDVSRLRFTVYFMFGSVFTMVVGILVFMLVRISLLNKTVSRIEASTSRCSYYMYAVYIVNQLVKYVTDTSATAYVAQLKVALGSTVGQLYNEHNSLTLGNLRTNYPEVQKFNSDNRVAIIQDGISIEGTFLRTLAQLSEVGFAMIQCFSNIAATAAGDALPASDVNYVQMNTDNLDQAFNYSISTYVDHRNSIIDSTKWVVIVLVAVSIFLLICVFTLILLFIHRIEMSKESIINLFLVIPKSYVKALYQKSWEKVHAVANESNLGLESESSSDSENSGNPSPVLPTATENAKEELSQDVIPATVAVEGATAPVALTNEDEGAPVMLMDGNESFMNASGGFGKTGYSLSRTMENESVFVLEMDEDEDDYEFTQEDKEAEDTEQECLSGCSQSISKFFLKPVVILVLSVILVFLAAVSFGMVHSLHKTTKEALDSYEDTTLFFTLMEGYYRYFAELTRFSQQYVLTGAVVHPQRYYDYVLNTDIQGQFTSGLYSFSDINTLQAVINIEQVINSATTRQQVAIWLASVFYNPPQDHLYIFTRINAVKQEYDFTVISSVLHALFAPYNPVLPDPHATTTATDEALSSADKLTVAKNLMFDDYYQDHRFLMLKYVDDFIASKDNSDTQNHKLQVIYWYVSIATISVCLILLLIILRETVAKRRSKILIASIIVASLTAAASIVMLGLSKKNLESAYDHNSITELYTTASNLTTGNLLAAQGYALRMVIYGYESTEQLWNNLFSSHVENQLSDLLYATIKRHPGTDAYYASLNVTAAYASVEQVMYYSSIAAQLAISIWNLPASPYLDGFSYNIALEPMFQLALYSTAANQDLYTSTEGDMGAGSDASTRQAKAYSAVSGERFDFVTSSSFKTVDTALTSLQEQLDSGWGKIKDDVSRYTLVGMALGAIFLGIVVLLMVDMGYNVFMMQSMSRQHKSVSKHQIVKKIRTRTSVVLKLFFSIAILIIMLVAILVLFMELGKIDRNDSTSYKIVHTRLLVLLQVLVNAQNMWYVQGADSPKSPLTVPFMKSLDYSTSYLEDLYLGDSDKYTGILHQNRSADTALFGSPVYEYLEYSIGCQEFEVEKGYSVLDFTEDVTTAANPMWLDRLFSYGAENVWFQYMLSFANMAGSFDAQQREGLRLPITSTADALVARTLSIFHGFYASEDDRSQFFVYFVISLVAVLLVMIIVVLFVVIIPLLRHLVQEEEGTRLLIRMIPENIRRDVPMLHDFFENGSVNPDIQLLTDACSSFENSCLIVVREDDHILEATDEALRRFMYSKEEMIGALFDRLLSPERAKDMVDYRQQMGTSRLKVVVGKTIRSAAMRSDGVIFPIELYIKEVAPTQSMPETLYVLRVRPVQVECQIELTRRIHNSLSEASQHPLLVMDPAGTIHVASKACELLFGVECRDLVGEHVSILLNSKEDNGAPELNQFLSKCQSSEEPCTATIEAIGRGKHDLEIPLTVSLASIVNEDKIVTYVVASMIDMSDHFTAKQMSAASRTAIHSSPVPVVMFDGTGRIVAFSPAAERSWGYSAEHALRLRVNDLLHEIDGERFTFTASPDSDLRYFLGVTRALVARRNNGERFVVEARMKEMQTEDGDNTVICYFKDLSKEMEISHRNIMSQAAFDMSPVAIIVIDETGKVKGFNKASEKLFGYRTNDIVDQENVSLLMPDNIAAKHNEYLRRYAHTGVKTVINNPRREYAKRADGRLFAVELRIIELELDDVLSDADSRKLFVGYVRDMSEQYQMQRANEINDAITKHCPTPIISIDKNGIVLSFNPAASKLFEYSPMAVIGKNVSMLMPDRYAHHHDSYIQRAARNHSSQVDSMRDVVGLTSSQVEIPVRIHVMELKKGVVDPIYVASVKDVSVKSKIQDECKLEQAFISMYPRSIVVTNRRGVVKFFSDGAAKAFAFHTTEAAVGTSFMALINGDDFRQRELIVASLLDVDSVNFGQPRQINCVRRNGVPFVANITAKRMEDTNSKSRAITGNNDSIVLMLDDLTQQGLLQKSTKIHDELLNKFDYGTAQLDETGTVTAINDVFMRELALTSKVDAVGKKISALINNEVGMKLMQQINAFAAAGVTGEVFSNLMEFQLTRHNRTKVHLELIIRPLREEEKISFLVYIRNINASFSDRNHRKLIRDVIDTAPLPAIVVRYGWKKGAGLVGEDGTIYVTNSSALEQFQYSLDEITGKHLQSILTPTGRGSRSLTEQFHVASKGDQKNSGRSDASSALVSLTTYAIGMRKDRSTFPVRVSLMESFDAERNHDSLFIFMEETTELIKQQVSNGVGAAATAICPLSIVCCNLSGEIVLFTEQAESMFGYTEQEVVGQPAAVLVDTRNCGSWIAKMQEADPALRTAPLSLPRVIGKRKDGNLISIEITMYEAEGGSSRERLFVSLMRDTTSELADSLAGQLSKVAMMSFGNPFVVMSAAGMIEIVNDAFSELVMYTKDELLRNTVKILLTPDIRRKDGKEIPVELLVGVYRSHGKTSMYVFASSLEEAAELKKEYTLTEVIATMEKMAVLHVGADGVIKDATTSASRFFNYMSDQTLAGRQIQRVFPAIDNFPEFVEKNLPQDRNDLSGRLLEGRLRTGESLYCSVGIKEISTQGDEISYAFLLHSFITQEDQQKRLLRKSLEALPTIGVVVNDVDDIIVYANDEAARIFGYSPSELLGQNIGILMSQEIKDDHKKSMDDYLRDGKENNSFRIGQMRRVMAKRKDGSGVPIGVRIDDVQTPRGKEFFGFVIDLTNEEHQSNAEKVSSALLSLYPVPVLIVSNNGKVLTCSTSAATTMKLNKKKVIGSSITNFIRSAENILVEGEHHVSIIQTKEEFTFRTTPVPSGVYIFTIHRNEGAPRFNLCRGNADRTLSFSFVFTSARGIPILFILFISSSPPSIIQKKCLLASGKIQPRSVLEQQTAVGNDVEVCLLSQEKRRVYHNVCVVFLWVFALLKSYTSICRVNFLHGMHFIIALLIRSVTACLWVSRYLVQYFSKLFSFCSSSSAMLRWTCRRCAALPFEPMALTTLDFLNGHLQREVPLGREEGIEAFRNGYFFISPKHDGVRVVSYVDPTATLAPLGLDADAAVTSYNQQLKTCFSRHGRPIWGMQWLEQELHLLRAVAGDPFLVVDGELYLHKERTERKAHSQKHGECVDPSARFMTGFLAVASLVHRLRGKLQNPTAKDILQHVPSLPLYCLFDVASYSPTAIQPPKGRKGNGGHHLNAVKTELWRIQQRCLREHQINDIRTLHIIPNVTPFSLRLRALSFFGSLLRCTMESKILVSAFCPWYIAEGSALEKKKKSRNVAGDSSVVYQGGRYVKIIPYSLCESLKDAQDHFLKKYIRRGFEGAVIRTPLNVYAMREKRAGTVAKIVKSGIVDRKKGSLRTGPTRRCPISIEKFGRSPRASLNGTRRSKEVSGDEQLIVSAVTRAKRLPRRSPTAVKLLLYKDDEFPVLRPLFKEPSSNPRTRQLAQIDVSDLGAGDKIKTSGVNGIKNSSKVSFFGLQCLASNGHTFSVTLPKLSMKKQVELLRHLKEAQEGKNGTLTGLYVTVKFSTLTEHGIPRFGTVKAIRGGKGWFL